MKALILVGGFGTRLRPITCTRPKPLIPVVNEPIIRRMIRLLQKCSITDVVLGVHYRSQQLQDDLGDGRKLGVAIHYSEEEEPLGTAGPIKLAEDLLKDDKFFVLNSDIVSSLDYLHLIKTHNISSTIGTLALYEVEDPRRFGVVELDEEDRVTRFVEKPSTRKHAKSLINAGAYILTPEIFSYIPSGVPCSLEREIFPQLVEERQLSGYVFQGYWTDTGRPEDYLDANKLIMEYEGVTQEIDPSSDVSDQAVLRPPLIIGKNCKIMAGCRIGPYTVMGDNNIIKENSSLSHSITFEHVRIGEHCSISDTILGEGVRIGKRTKVNGITVIGDYVEIDSDLTIHAGVKICPWKNIKQSISEAANIM
ncbi:MAG: sugar phosphate nucleotidyltransferase [Candidatus Ranarchaeia archaeon]